MDYSNEEWKPILGFERYYQVSDFGRVKKLCTKRGTPVNRIRNPYLNQSGYPTVQIFNGSKASIKSVLVHKLVAAAFIGSPTHGMEVNHKNGEKTDNRVCNLEYVTHLENMRHAFASGLAPRGSKRGHAILEEHQIPTIRKEAASGVYLSVIARKYGVSRTTIFHIVNRNKWKHVA